MREYCERDTLAHNEEPGTDATPPCTAAVPAYMSLADYYGLHDMAIGRSHRNKQTISQEYQAYIMAPLSAAEVDILKFWEVGNFLPMLYHTHRIHRFITMHFLLSMRWQWIIFQSKHPRYPVNTSFLQVLKWI